MTTPPTGFTRQGSRSADQIGPSAQELGEQVRQSILNARQEALKAARQEGGERLNLAIKQLRAAETQLRKARTQDQIGAAEQAVNGAEAELNAAEAQLNAVKLSQSISGTVQPHPSPASMIPRQAVDIATGFFVMCAVMVVGWPLARAFGRRVERGGKPPELASAMPEQLQRIEQAVDAMSIEVERISESQRFMAKLRNVSLAEGGALRSDDRG